MRERIYFTLTTCLRKRQNFVITLCELITIKTNWAQNLLAFSLMNKVTEITLSTSSIGLIQKLAFRKTDSNWFTYVGTWDVFIVVFTLLACLEIIRVSLAILNLCLTDTLAFYLKIIIFILTLGALFVLGLIVNFALSNVVDEEALVILIIILVFALGTFLVVICRICSVALAVCNGSWSTNFTI